METKTIELIGGYTAFDKKAGKEVTHREVTFGKRLTGQDIFNLDNDPQAKNPTQYNDLVRRQMITKFGTLKTPVSLNALLSLDSIDRDDLNAAANEFTINSRGERTSEYISLNEVRLGFGFVIDETEYTVVKFGNRFSGKDEVDADKFGDGAARTCFLIGKQISKISTADGTASIDGQVSLDKFNSLDEESISILRIGAEFFRQSFRLPDSKNSTKPDNEGGNISNEGNTSTAW